MVGLCSLRGMSSCDAQARHSQQRREGSPPEKQSFERGYGRPSTRRRGGRAPVRSSRASKVLVHRARGPGPASSCPGPSGEAPASHLRLLASPATLHRDTGAHAAPYKSRTCARTASGPPRLTGTTPGATRGATPAEQPGDLRRFGCGAITWCRHHLVCRPSHTASPTVYRAKVRRSGAKSDAKPARLQAAGPAPRQCPLPGRPRRRDEMQHPASSKQLQRAGTVPAVRGPRDPGPCRCPLRSGMQVNSQQPRDWLVSKARACRQ